MNIRTHILVAVVVLIALWVLVNQIRKRKLKLRDSLIWFLLDAGILLFACFPGMTDGLAGSLGVSTPVNLLFFLGFLFLIVIVFAMAQGLSHLSGEVKTLTQELALLKDECEKLKNEKNT